ncbi:MAG: Polyketide cyclase / dehydrase and lipid transport [Thermoleophilia bacterium]|nr:Polyketide cyclase / dehydrase and lipid transport [Thermoleophilia bacterium]
MTRLRPAPHHVCRTDNPSIDFVHDERWRRAALLPVTCCMADAPLNAKLPLDPDGVYAFLTDLDFLPQWYPAVRRISVRGGGPPTLGARLVEHRRAPLVPGMRIVVPMQVTDARAGVRYAVRAWFPRTCSIDASYELEPSLDEVGTFVRVRYEVEPMTRAALPACRAIGWVLATQGRAQVAAMPRGLAAWRGEPSGE